MVNVQSFFHGGSVEPRAVKKSDRIVYVAVTSEAVKSDSGNIVYGKAPFLRNQSVVSTFLAPSGTEATLSFIVNVTAHEVGHGSKALPLYAQDNRPPGSTLHSFSAKEETTMEQGASSENLGKTTRSFSEKDAAQLSGELNDDADDQQ